jgi:DNA polymerase-3 subunit delta'
MALSPVVGHDAVRSRLVRASVAGRLPSSVLLAGPRGIGKQRLALWAGQYLLCERALADALPAPCDRCQPCRYALRLTHPDLHWFFPRPRAGMADAMPSDIQADLREAIAERVEGHGLWVAPPGTDGLLIAAIRTVVHLASSRPALGHRSIFVIGDAERMVAQEGADQAANAFLKLLEEPPAHVTLMLTSSEAGALLPTIRSRVITVRVAPVSRAATMEFLRIPEVSTRLAVAPSDESAMSALVDRAQGAPGTLLAADVGGASTIAARAVLDAALMSGPEGRARQLVVVSKQGSAQARGAFSDMLDALTLLLHRWSGDLLSGSHLERARLATEAIAAVERAKQLAHGNVNPQLITAHLMQFLIRLGDPA